SVEICMDQNFQFCIHGARVTTLGLELQICWLKFLSTLWRWLD
ncbi:hypothetical protein A2U01_0055751, partial [Trifolium medium]|nr:hypothetical protein [Trifolium medium]